MFNSIDNLIDTTSINFTGYEVGDVNFSADPDNLIATDDRSNKSLVFETSNEFTQRGEYVAITFQSSEPSSFCTNARNRGLKKER